MTKTTNKILQKETGLTYNGLMYRIKAMAADGIIMDEHYGRGGIRYYEPGEVEQIKNFKPKKPGRKRAAKKA